MATATATSLITAGVDVGSSVVKTVVLRCHEPDRRDSPADVLALRRDRIRRRDLRKVIHESYEAAVEEAGIARGDVEYVASTGEGEMVDFRRGHFYGMTTHARGATFLVPEARAAIDVGALHARAMRFDENSRVLAYRMTSQCASGSGQFLENVTRYLGVPLEEAGALSCRSKDPEAVSSICAVLAETDVINMVSRGIATEDILKGIHLSMAGRYVRLLRAVKAEEDVVLVGGLGLDVGMVEALRESVAKEQLPFRVRTHEHAIFTGALGAALWGGYRHTVLSRRAG